MANGQNPWEIARRELITKRSNAVEKMLINGNGQVDCNNLPTYGMLGGANVLSPGSVGTIRGGCEVCIGCGVALIEEALADCLGSEIGMIHISGAPSLQNCDAFYHDVIDYGDGMGSRTVQRTKSRGNIVVTGGGYTGGIGPDGCPCGPGEAWIYGTSLVHLVYGHPMYTPDRQNFNFDGTIIEIEGATANATTNDLFILAEQAVVPVISKCCRFATKITTNKCC